MLKSVSGLEVKCVCVGVRKCVFAHVCLSAIQPIPLADACQHESEMLARSEHPSWKFHVCCVSVFVFEV